MPTYDSEHWDWGRGCCARHRGQGVPCRACIDGGDPDVTIEGIPLPDANASNLAAVELFSQELPDFEPDADADDLDLAAMLTPLGSPADAPSPEPVNGRRWPWPDGKPRVVVYQRVATEAQRVEPGSIGVQVGEQVGAFAAAHPDYVDSLMAMMARQRPAPKIDTEAMRAAPLAGIIRERIAMHREKLRVLEADWAADKQCGPAYIASMRWQCIERRMVQIAELEAVLKLAGLEPGGG